jgi:ferredoxin
MADIANKPRKTCPESFTSMTSALTATCAGKPHPANFMRSDEGGYFYVFKQPTTPEGKALCKEATGGCPVEAIGHNGEG